MRSGCRPISSSALTTPTCTKPRGPPELNTQATRAGRGRGAAVGASAPVWSASGSSAQPASSPAASNALRLVQVPPAKRARVLKPVLNSVRSPMFSPLFSPVFNPSSPQLP